LRIGDAAAPSNLFNRTLDLYRGRSSVNEDEYPTMTTHPSAATAPVELTAAVRQRVFLYLGILIVLLAFGGPSGGLIDIPIGFFLKNRLHLTAREVAAFRLVAAAPLYLAFVFGFIRDIWNPLGLRDRGFMLLFGAMTALLYLLCAFMPMNYGALLITVIVVTTAFLFVSSAQNGLTSAIAQQHAMTGQVSAVWNVLLSIPTVAALLLGGSLSGLLEEQHPDLAVRILFLAGAAIMAVVALYALWKPAAVFDNVRIEQDSVIHPLRDLTRLVRHRPIYPALLIWLLWNFAPGSATPLQYYLQNTLRASDAQWGQWNAIFAFSFVPTFVLYGWLCRRLTLRALLWWGTVAAVPQMVPLLFIDSVRQALIAAVPIGLMGGVATGAYLDLIMRSCPRGLQGTMLMMSSSLYFVVQRFGDVLGTTLYDRYGGFTVCVIAITLVYALILPALLLVPAALIATADGQAPEPEPSP
jgi:Na+/melibiose symporter-like transporter